MSLRSWIEPELAARLSSVLRAIGASIVLASDWRVGRTLAHLADELRAAGVDGTLVGVTPELGQGRYREIEAWMLEHGVAAERVVIVDDGYDMGPLASRFVRVSPLHGLDDDAVRAIRLLFEPEKA